ncbi:MAG: lipoate protein ligase C-terminal domain-containing protein [Patescibacteria group bacterium]|jgi:lipoate-protein ligase A
MLSAVYKIPNGKLLKIFLELDNNIIKNIKITGDFFIYPEEAIMSIEQALLQIPIIQERLKQKIQAVISAQQLELFGVDIESIVKTILLAANS